ncbi:MAG: hypothetical protein LBJ71_05255 [Holosporaceae bacterium]|jgi:hypothetical protein|nr:hypothetical protein [Holosporaceae bacterium]
MLKKSIFIGLFSGLLAFNSFAAITGEDIPFTSDAMKNLPVTFADALAAIKSGVILEMRNYGNIRYNKDSERSPVGAQNEGIDDVAKLLITLFPSNSGVLEITTGHDENFAKILNKIKEGKSEESYEIIAELLNVCRQARNNEQPSGLEDKIKRWTSGLKNKRRALQALTNIFKQVADSVLFEESFKGALEKILYYPPHMTETLILAFCCYFFNGSAGDVKKLLDAMKSCGLIGDYDSNSNSNSIFLDNLSDEDRRAKLEQYRKEINDIIAEAAPKIASVGFLPTRTITLEQYLHIIGGETEIVPYSSNALFEQNLNVRCRSANGRFLSFSDCVETTIRHLITMMCKYDAKKDVIEVPDGFNDKVKEFFQKYNGRSSVNGHVQAVHNNWAQLCQEISDVVYGRDGSLKSSWPNVLFALKYFTNSPVEISKELRGVSNLTKEGLKEKQQKIISLLNEITQKCRNDVIFKFKAMGAEEIKCIITQKTQQNPEAEQSNQQMRFVISVGNGHSSLLPASGMETSLLYSLIELEEKKIMKAIMIERSLTPEDDYWRNFIASFKDRCSYTYLAGTYFDYLHNCSSGGVPAGSIGYLLNYPGHRQNYHTFLLKSLGTAFDCINLNEHFSDPTDSLFKPIKVVMDLLYKEKEGEIQELTRNTLPPRDDLLSLKDGYEDKIPTNRFITIISHLINLSKHSPEAASMLRDIKAVTINQDLVLTDITGEIKQNFLRQNTVCDVKILHAAYPDRFDFVAPEGGAIIKIIYSNFQKGGSLDLRKCNKVEDYIYDITEYYSSKLSWQSPMEMTWREVEGEKGKINKIITLPTSEKFSLNVYRP